MLWLQLGDKNTRFFQRMDTAHRKYNTIDRLVIENVEVVQPEGIKRAMVEFYQNMCSETEVWRPSFEFTKLSESK